MRRFLTTILLLAATLTICADDKSDKMDADAKAVAEAMFAAMKAKDVDGLMKAIEAPVYMDVEVVKTQDELKEMFTYAFTKGKKDFGDIKFTVSKVVPFDKFEEAVGKKMKDELRETLKGLHGPGGRVVFATAEYDGKKDQMYVGVRFKDGKAKVCASSR